MTTLKAFHNDPAIKTKYLARLTAHVKADELIHGKGWENGKGCAVGCTLDKYDHAAYETELGIPESLARLEDTLFEGQPNGTSKTFPVRFLQAIPVGADLSLVTPRFIHWLLIDPTHGVIRFANTEPCRDAINGVAVMYAGWIKTKKKPAAWAAARAAAWASGAAGAAAWASNAAYSVYRSAYSAARAAYSAAWSAASVYSVYGFYRADEADEAANAANAAARDAHYEVMAEKLITLLQETA